VLRTASALVSGVVGVALTFAPQEVLAAAGADPQPPLVVLAQFGGAMSLAWAILDWMSRGQRLGGIYNRPLAQANMLHFLMASLALVKVTAQHGFGALGIALVVAYAVLTIWWAVALLTSPV
jgi:hypothetical protein